MRQKNLSEVVVDCMAGGCSFVKTGAAELGVFFRILRRQKIYGDTGEGICHVEHNLELDGKQRL